MIEIVSEAYLKTVTAIAGNIDVDDLKPFIVETQNNRVQELLGKKFYDYLVGKTLAELTTNERTLIEYIRPYLAWYIVYDALPFIHYKIKNKGVVGGVGETVERAGLNELKYLRTECENKAEGYGQRLQDFLWKNRADYDYYIHPDNKALTPYQGTTYKSGIIFEDHSSCGRTDFRNNYPYNE
jgi:hypothetical protein